MKPFLELFKPGMPDEASLAPVIELPGKDGDTLLQLRIFNLIADLSYVKPWLRDPEKRTNWKAEEMIAPVFRYEKLLNGLNTQSFMIMIGGKQEVQMDLIRVRPSSGLFSSPKKSEDAAISFICIAQHRKPKNFISALEIMAIYFFSFTETGSLFININAGQRDTVSDVLAVGFADFVKPAHPVKDTNTYKLTKQQFENRSVDLRWNP